ncbi:tetraacyldisaccharide 4'-kinase [Aquimarina aquimarini]|uniref:tetraacyldisaccharide 4'-kinase n=1 Tax=Aquimarina aquimarini TaxID=1191734 RepID=UPI000D54E9E4|nr:tetraacyldisaccharide 4'-kinase [Aquimarina aquimarini]
MNLLRKLLLPFVPFYYIVTWLRNLLYDMGIKESTEYNFPLIAVGNLSVGGTGKSPMVEYLIILLKEQVMLATLSRGYKRETNGFQLVTPFSTAKEVGDEPLQFKKKFKEITVSVDADRRSGIAKLRSLSPQPEVILLDDAYQHRKIKAGFYILLTAYYDLYCDDITLPTGNLREPRKGANRANIIVVTKCPSDLSQEEKERITGRLNIQSHQYLFFTTISYGETVRNTSKAISIDNFKNTYFTLVTGIANPKPLVDYYKSLGLKFDHISFPDHHNFTDTELKELNNLELIITTEKDHVRLASYIAEEKLWYQPIKVEFVEDASSFDTKILEYIQK